MTRLSDPDILLSDDTVLWSSLAESSQVFGLSFPTISAISEVGRPAIVGPTSARPTQYEQVYDHIRNLVNVAEFNVVVPDSTDGITVLPKKIRPSSVSLDDIGSNFGVPRRPNMREFVPTRRLSRRWTLEMRFAARVSLEHFESLFEDPSAAFVPADQENGLESLWLLAVSSTPVHPKPSESDEGTRVTYQLVTQPTSQPLTAL